MHITPDVLEQEFSLSTAVSRLDFLSRRDSAPAVVDPVVDEDDDWTAIRHSATSLDVPESLELLALGELVARKAHDSRLVGIRAALRGGAGWAEIAAALGVTPAQAEDLYREALGGADDAGAADDGAADDGAATPAAGGPGGPRPPDRGPAAWSARARRGWPRSSR